MAEIIRYSNHKIIRLRQTSHIQRMTIGDSWSKLTMGLLCKLYMETIPASNTYLGEQGLHIGFCSGPGTGRDSYSSAAVNFIGLKLAGNSLFQTDPFGSSYSGVHMNYFYGSKFQGATETATAALDNGTYGSDVSINLKYSGYYTVLGVQIDRVAETITGLSPLSQSGYPYALTSSSTDKNTFRYIIRQDSTLYTKIFSALSLAMPSGPLDHVCIYKSAYTCAFDIAAISIHRLA